MPQPLLSATVDIEGIAELPGEDIPGSRFFRLDWCFAEPVSWLERRNCSPIAVNWAYGPTVSTELHRFDVPGMPGPAAVVVCSTPVPADVLSALKSALERHVAETECAEVAA
jgi:hypothetical protein